MSAGPNSCHFDSSHTTIWMIYCMNVTAVTAQRNYTSQEHCLDVAEIGKDEMVVLVFSRTLEWMEFGAMNPKRKL